MEDACIVEGIIVGTLVREAIYYGSAALAGWWGANAWDEDVDHPEEEEALNATCEDASWAIPKLKELIASRKRQYKASGGGRIDLNPTGPGHRQRIKKLEDKLKWLEECPKTC